jgi:hypothetical protein
MESLIDLAEEKIAGRIDRDDYNAICFFLRTKGKHRGWGEQPLVQLPNAIKIQIEPIGYNPQTLIEEKDVVDVEVEQIEEKKE